MNQIVSGGMYGNRLAAFVGMSSPPATVNRPVRGKVFAATRLVAPPNPTRRLRVPNERAYIFSVQLRAAERRDLWVDGKKTEPAHLAAGSVAFYDLERNIESYGQSGGESLQFYVPRDALEIQEIGLETGAVLQDETILHLAHGMLPTLENPSTGDAPFVEEMALALHAHIARAYGRLNVPNDIARGGLAPWQRRRANEMLTTNFAKGVTLTQVATECGLSVGHFARAFKECIRESPHKWLVKQRVDRAKGLLTHGGAPLAEIAIDCGFSDQSHFTRIFARETGTPPGQWRRGHRCGRIAHINTA